jgi:hypothetical protein
MRTTLAFLALLVVAMLFSIGGAPSTALGDERTMSGGPMASCELRFHAMDIGGKGYLSDRDLRESYYGPSINDSRGRVASKFGTMDENGDGKVSPTEYCEWRAPIATGPMRAR